MEHKTLKSTTKPKKPKTLQAAAPEYQLVDLYLQPEFMHVIAQQIAGQTKVDQSKVAALKAAIANKTFKINELALAEQIVKFESELFNNNKT